MTDRNAQNPTASAGNAGAKAADNQFQNAQDASGQKRSPAQQDQQAQQSHTDKPDASRDKKGAKLPTERQQG